jgi:hypothetical protein
METALIGLVVIIASTVGTLTGFGTSTIMVPIMALFFPLPQTLLFVGIIHWFGDIWKLLLFRSGFKWKLVLAFGLPGIVFAFIGARLVFGIPNEILSRILGAFLIAYVAYLFFRSSFRVRPNMFTGAVGGALSGFMAGIFGIGGAVRSMFLTAFNLPKEVYIATAGAIALVIDSTRLGTYLMEGARLEQTLLCGLLLFVPLSFVGAAIAKRIVDKIPQEHFRQFVAVFLLLTGLKLLIWPG